MALESPGCEPVVLDLGTGLRRFGQTLPQDGSFRGHAFVTHLHWDHVQGLPFFTPVLVPGARLDVYAPPPQAGVSVSDAFHDFMRPPYFPVRPCDLHGEVVFHDVADCELQLGSARVVVRSVPHVGPTNGYRIEMGGASVVYVSDHQQPCDGTDRIDEAVLDLCRGADLLIHDAQFTEPELARKRDWGHCTLEYAVHVAATAGVRRLALFHHDPARSDEAVDRLLPGARELGRERGLDEVLAAAEGLTICLSPSSPSPPPWPPWPPSSSSSSSGVRPKASRTA
ncbi:MAG: MBL fold metallo-hydrolase [Actinobacteria bacterium]|nr:MBL fold metallo-hydrolase [Actinomycetota bacterium]